MTDRVTVEYPELRRNLKEAAWCLSDQSYQKTVWGNPSDPPPDNMFPFEDAVAYVLDDMAFDELGVLVGKVLIDECELAALRNLVRRLGAVVDELGPRTSFGDVAGRSDWGEVRGAALSLLASLERGNRRAGIT